MRKVFELFAKKDGKFSKTAVFLSLGVFVLLFLWPFQCLFGGVALGWWVVPPFSIGAATAVMSILSTLYVANHRLTGNNLSTEEMQRIRDQFTEAVSSMRGENNVAD
jgi:hypothetical protein